MNRAIVNKNDWSNSNTFVEYNSNTNCSTVVLHRTAIAVYDHNTNALKLNTGGWYSVTTKSRLNALLEEVKYGCKVFQKNWNWFVSDRLGNVKSFHSGFTVDQDFLLDF